MRAVIGLGNPGRRYERTRHNLGFQVADCFAARHGVRDFEERGALLCARLPLGGDPVLVVKPITYMNASGSAVRELREREGIEARDLVVAHDDLDLELGAVRVKLGGGHGGHNGLRSIFDETGETAFARVRLGIRRPDPELGAVEWVLGEFPESEREQVRALVERGASAVEAVLALGAERAMNELNRRLPSAPAGATGSETEVV